jgi:hypothetical protein
MLFRISSRRVAIAICQINILQKTGRLYLFTGNKLFPISCHHGARRQKKQPQLFDDHCRAIALSIIAGAAFFIAQFP